LEGWPALHSGLGEAEKFNGYKAFGNAKTLVEPVSPRVKEYVETGYWHGTLEELRAALFWYQRQWRWQTYHSPDANDGLVRELYAQLRAMWGRGKVGILLPTPSHDSKLRRRKVKKWKQGQLFDEPEDK